MVRTVLELDKNGSVKLDDIANAIQAEIDMLDIDIAKARKTILDSKKRLKRAMRALTLIKTIYISTEQDEVVRCDICGARTTADNLETHKRTHGLGIMEPLHLGTMKCSCGFTAASKSGLQIHMKKRDGLKHERVPA